MMGRSFGNYDDNETLYTCTIKGLFDPHALKWGKRTFSGKALLLL